MLADIFQLKMYAPSSISTSGQFLPLFQKGVCFRQVHSNHLLFLLEYENLALPSLIFSHTLILLDITCFLSSSPLVPPLVTAQPPRQSDHARCFSTNHTGSGLDMCRRCSPVRTAGQLELQRVN